jgi:Serine phosphatase RsbU, regulator of sigma subunit
VFLCVLELSTGKLVCVNAGHNPPLIKKSESKFEYFTCEPNLVAGVMKGINYTSCQTRLNPGDSIFLYTDGITEALNEDNEFYGEQRLITTLNSVNETSGNVENILSKVKSDVQLFMGKEPQADDITMLAFTYKGFTNPNSIVLGAKVENYAKLVSWLDKKCNETEISDSNKHKLNIAVEEIFVNISNYAYPPKEGDVEITFKINDSNQIEMQFVDTGIPYNPLDKKDPDITLGIKDRPIGGLGIFMVKNYTDEINYSYENGKNILTIKLDIK